MQNPTQEKFRKIRQSNKAYQERIAVLEGTELFMQSAGFMSQIVDEQERYLAEQSERIRAEINDDLEHLSKLILFGVGVE